MKILSKIGGAHLECTLGDTYITSGHHIWSFSTDAYYISGEVRALGVWAGGLK